MIHITSEPLNPEHITNTVKKNSNGAVLTFLGTTRNCSEGRNVLYLEYEAYQPMAHNMLLQIKSEVNAHWNIEDMAIAHRIGHLDVGDISLIVAIGSPHRKEALEASEYAIDRIKQIVPIWKKEVFEGGEEWLGDEDKRKEFLKTLSD